MHVCVYIYLKYTHILCKEKKRLFWMQLIAINCLIALKYTIHYTVLYQHASNVIDWLILEHKNICASLI